MELYQLDAHSLLVLVYFISHFLFHSYNSTVAVFCNPINDQGSGCRPNVSLC